jgi:aminopeptidase N
VPNAEAILDEQASRITNPDRIARFRFMRAALSDRVATRDSLFRTFADVENRRRESWVLDAMGAMHHPLRAEAALPNVRAALDLVPDIQRTGDIFFPLRWLNVTLDGHRSPRRQRPCGRSSTKRQRCRHVCVARCCRRRTTSSGWPIACGERAPAARGE